MLAFAIAAPFLFRDRLEQRLHTELERRASKAIGVPVHIGAVDVWLATLRPRIELREIHVELPGDDTIEASRAEIFLGAGLNVEVDAPRIRASVERGLPSLADGGSGFRLGTLVLKNGTVDVSSERGIEIALDHVDALVTHESAGVVFDVRAGGRHVRALVGEQKIDEPVESFRGRIILREDSVEIREGRLETGRASVFVDASVALDGTNVDATRFEITAPLPPWRGLAGTIAWIGPASLDASGFRGNGSVEIAAGEDLRVGGTVSVWGTTAPFAMDGETALTWSGVTAGRSTRVPDGVISGGFAASRSRVVLRDALVSAGTSRVSLDGVVGLDGTLNLAFGAEPLALSALSPIEGVDVGGTGPVTDGRVTGTIDAPVIEGRAALAGIRIGDIALGDGEGPVRVSFADGSISSPSTRLVLGESAIAGSWSVGLRDGRIEIASRESPIALAGTRLEDFASTRLLPFLDGARARVTDGTLWLAGSVAELDGAVRATAVEAEAHGQRVDSMRVNARLERGAVTLDDVLAKRASGAEVFARGRIGAAPENALDLEVHANGTFGDVDALAARLPESVRSSFALRARAMGTLAAPDLRGNLRLTETRFEDRQAGDSLLELRIERDELVVTGTLAGGRLTPLARISRDGLHATLDGPSGKRLPLGAAAKRLPSEGPALRRLALAASRADGEWTLTGNGAIDLGLVPLVTGHVTRASGTLDVTSLRLSASRYRVEATVRDAAFANDALPISPAETNAALVLEDGVLAIHSLSGAIGGGTFALNGGASLAVSSPACVDALSAPITLSSVTLPMKSAGLTARVSGPLRVTGGTCGESVPVLGGALSVEHAKYTGAPASSGNAPTGGASPPARARISLDLALTATGGGLHVKNGALKAELATSAPVRVVGTDLAPIVSSGRLRLVKGTLFVQRVGFALDHTDVEFLGGSQTDARYSVRATKKLGPIEVIVRADGQLSRGEPKIRVSTTPRLSEDDARKLLEKHGIDHERLELRSRAQG